MDVENQPEGSSESGSPAAIPGRASRAARPSRLRRVLGWSVRLVVLGALGLVLILSAANAWVMASAGRTHDLVEQVPPTKVGMVLGCFKITAAGVLNATWVYRMDATANLYRTGKIDWVIVSGAGTGQMNEMTLALVERGVPFEQIYHDPLGVRTLDSMVRAQRVFGLDRFTIISQRFHNRRALFLARAHGLDPVAYNARTRTIYSSARNHLRENFARVKAMLDIYWWSTEPRFGDLMSQPLPEFPWLDAER